MEGDQGRSNFIDPRAYDPDALAALLQECDDQGLLPDVARNANLGPTTMRNALHAPENRGLMKSTRLKLYLGAQLALEERRSSAPALVLQAGEERAIDNALLYGVRTFPCSGMFHIYGWPLNGRREENGFLYYTLDPASRLYAPIRGANAGRFERCPTNRHPGGAYHISDRDLRELSELVGRREDVWGDSLTEGPNGR